MTVSACVLVRVGGNWCRVSCSVLEGFGVVSSARHGMDVSARVSLSLPHTDQRNPSMYHGARLGVVSARCLCVYTLASI